MPTWPASLPQFVSSENYNESPPQTLIRSSIDIGIVKQRSRASKGSRSIKVVVEMESEQVEILDVFYVTELAQGALSFNWVHPRTEIISTFRFTDAPSYSTISGVVFKVTLPLEIVP